MAVTSANLYKRGTTGGGRTNDGKVKYTAWWIVETNTVRDQTAVICDYFKNAGNLPYLNKVYSYGNDNDPSAICSGIFPERQTDSQTSWLVRFDYATPEGSKKEDDEPDRKEKDNNGNLTNDPTQWREKWDIGFTQRTIECEKVIYRGGMTGGRAIPVNSVTPMINSAREPFIPQPDKEHDITVYRRSFYKAEWTSDLAETYQGKVNENALNVQRFDICLNFNAAQYCARIKSIGGGLEWINNFPFWLWSIEVWVDPLGWRKVVADRGLNKMASDGYATGRGSNYTAADFVAGRSRLVPILDASGDPIRTPVLLDGNGDPLITGDAFPNPIWLTYTIYDEINFPLSLFGVGG